MERKRERCSEVALLGRIRTRTLTDHDDVHSKQIQCSVRTLLLVVERKEIVEERVLHLALPLRKEVSSGRRWYVTKTTHHLRSIDRTYGLRVIRRMRIIGRWRLIPWNGNETPVHRIAHREMRARPQSNALNAGRDA